jgi:hypothetical protein
MRSSISGGETRLARHVREMKGASTRSALWRARGQQYGKPGQDPKADSRLGDPGPVRGVSLEAEASEESKQTTTLQAGLDIGFAYGHWYLPLLSPGIVRLIARAKRRSRFWVQLPSRIRRRRRGCVVTQLVLTRIRPDGDDRKMTGPFFS